MNGNRQINLSAGAATSALGVQTLCFDTGFTVGANGIAVPARQGGAGDRVCMIKMPEQVVTDLRQAVSANDVIITQGPIQDVSGAAGGLIGGALGGAPGAAIGGAVGFLGGGLIEQLIASNEERARRQQFLQRGVQDVRQFAQSLPQQ